MAKQQDKTTSWYNSNVEHFATQSDKYPPHSQINDFVRLLPKNAYVLDAGCGPGRDTNLLSQRGLEVTGIDLSEGLIEYAKKRFPALEFKQGSFLELPFGNESFDGVWAHASLVHLESVDEVKTALKEFARVLKNKGVIHIMVKAQLDEDKFKTVNDKRNRSERFFQFYTQEELKKCAHAAGLREVKMYQFADADSKQKYDNPVEWIVFLGEKIA